jgi:predicted small metal-binding protein
MEDKMTERKDFDQSEAEKGHREENDYREYICKEIYHNEECGFTIRGKDEDEIIEHAHMHQQVAHKMERSPDMDKQIRENIQTAPSAETMEYTCSGPECDFSVRGSTQDEIIEHAHMHQEVAHGMERSPDMDKQIREDIRPLSSSGLKAGSKEGSSVEPIKPGDPRVARRRGSLLDTCYPTSAGLPGQKK